MKRKLVLMCLALWVMIFGAMVPVSGARADELSDVRTYAQNLVDDAIVNIFNDKLSPAERVVPFRKVLTDNFDFDYISRFVLGVYARGVSDVKIALFAHEFAELNVVSYVKKFEAYTGSDIEIVDVKPGKKDGQFFVASKVRASEPGAKDYSVDWRIMRTDKGYKVIDVVVEGVSMALSYKNEYNPILKEALDAGLEPVVELTNKIQSKVIALKLK